VEVCTPVSETRRAGALPAAAANLIRADFNKEQTPRRNALNVMREFALCDLSLHVSRVTHHEL
jgi:hypothetical protein